MFNKLFLLYSALIGGIVFGLCAMEEKERADSQDTEDSDLEIFFAAAQDGHIAKVKWFLSAGIHIDKNDRRQDSTTLGGTEKPRRACHIFN